MQYRSLGDTGVQVSNVCLGTMMFGGVNNADHDDCVRIIHTALDAGVNFVDTADVYSQGESEEIVGKALRGRRDDVVLATKFQGAMGDERNGAARHAGGSSPRWRTRCAGWARTTSTSTSCTVPTRTPTSKRPWAPSPTSSVRARCSTSVTPPSRRASWSKHNGRPGSGGLLQLLRNTLWRSWRYGRARRPQHNPPARDGL